MKNLIAFILSLIFLYVFGCTNNRENKFISPFEEFNDLQRANINGNVQSYELCSFFYDLGDKSQNKITIEPCEIMYYNKCGNLFKSITKDNSNLITSYDYHIYNIIGQHSFVIRKYISNKYNLEFIKVIWLSKLNTVAFIIGTNDNFMVNYSQYDSLGNDVFSLHYFNKSLNYSVKAIRQFDDKRKITSIFLDLPTSFKSMSFVHFDNSGKEIYTVNKSTYYSSNESIIDTTYFEFVYDSLGNWIEMKEMYSGRFTYRLWKRSFNYYN